MRIGIVTQHPFPQNHDHRGRVLARTLARAGHQVTVFGSAITADDLDGMGIQIRAPKFNVVQRKTVPFNPFWANYLTEQGKHLGIECFLSKELRLAPSTWTAARWLNVPFCLDFSENYPAMVETERDGELALPVYRLIAGLLEIFCARRADLITVVTESNRTRLIKQGVPADRILVVSNTPEPAESKPRKPSTRDTVRFVFAGLITKVRGLDRFLAGLAGVRDKKGFQFDIIGDGPERPRMEALSAQLGLRGLVNFRGWMSRARLEEVLPGFDVGVIPHILSDHTNTTIPGKLFDYMAVGLPILSTDMVPCREVIQEVGCGWLASDTAEALSDAIETVLATTGESRCSMGERGRLAVLNRYNWKVDGARFLAAIERLTTPESIPMAAASA
jgi:glycosyltransferase involved in cell wall biosynthesis